MMVVLVVAYAGGADARFDETYYRDRHLPMVRAWLGAALVGLEAFVPVVAPGAMRMLTLLRFTSVAAMEEVLDEEAMAALMGDIATFTDLRPTIQLSRSLDRTERHL